MRTVKRHDALILAAAGAVALPAILGYDRDARGLLVEWLFAEGRNDPLSAFAAELVSAQTLPVPVSRQHD
jgi:hypothetical protein